MGRIKTRGLPSLRHSLHYAAITFFLFSLSVTELGQDQGKGLWLVRLLKGLLPICWKRQQL